MKFKLPSAKPSRQFALVTMRITARANTSRKVEGVMGYRHISRKCTRDNSTNRETTGPGLQKQSGNKNYGVKAADKRRMDIVREEVAVK